MKLSALNVFLLIIIVLLGIFMVFRKPETKIIRDAQKELTLKRSYDSSQRIIKELRDSVGNYKLAIDNLNRYSDLLSEKYKSQKSEISDLRKSLGFKEGLVKNLNSAQIAKEITSRYDTLLERGSSDTTAFSKDSIVTVRKVVGQFVIKDLYRLDELKKENTLLIEADSIQNARLQLKDSTINLYKRQKEAYDRILANKDNQNNILITQRTDLEKQVSKEKRKTTFYKIAAIVVASTVFIVKK